MRSQLVFVTKDDCGLCADALPAVERAAVLFRYELAIADVSDGHENFAERLPVVLDAEGGVILEGRIDLTDALAALARLRLGRG